MECAFSASASQSRRSRSASPSSFAVITVLVWALYRKDIGPVVAKPSCRTEPRQPASDNRHNRASARIGRVSANCLPFYSPIPRVSASGVTVVPGVNEKGASGVVRPRPEERLGGEAQQFRPAAALGGTVGDFLACLFARRELAGP